MDERKAIPLSRKNIRNFALQIRKIFKLERELAFPICKAYEILQEAGHFQYEIKSCEEMKDYEGRTFPNKKIIWIREDVYDGAAEGVGRHRFTMAHELGHLYMHKDVNVSYARSKAEVKTFEKPEWQADCFAGELLVPRNQCLHLDVNEIAEKCKVSPKAAAFQKKRFYK